MKFKKVLIAIDGSPLAGQGLDVGLALAADLNAEIGIINVIDTNLAYAPEAGIMVSQIIADMRVTGRKFLDDAIARVPTTAPKPSSFLKDGNPADQIVNTAKEWNADIIVIATHGRSGVSRLVMGSTAENVLRHSHCPVLAVKNQAGV